MACQWPVPHAFFPPTSAHSAPGTGYAKRACLFVPHAGALASVGGGVTLLRLRHQNIDEIRRLSVDLGEHRRG